MDAVGATSIAALIRGAFSGANSPNILCLPLFIFAGVLMAEGGISKKLFDVFAYFVGNKTGGMPCAVIITCLFYGAISSSGAATAAAIGAMTIPLLIELGYDAKFAAATVAVSGGLGVIIPPSGPFMMYGMATETSIGALFMAGILPGILVACLLMFYAVTYCKIQGEDKAKIQPLSKNCRCRLSAPAQGQFLGSALPCYNLGWNLCRHCYSYRSRCCIGVLCALCQPVYLQNSLLPKAP